MTRPLRKPSKLTGLKRRVHQLHTLTPLYEVSLRPKQQTPPLQDLPPLPWTGMSDLGKDMLQGQFTYFDKRKSLPAAWQVPVTDQDFFAYQHRFDWMYHLREVGGSAARRLARSLVSGWLDLFEKWDAVVWQEDILAQRLINCIGLYEFYGTSADDRFRMDLAHHVKRQHSHLERLVRLSDVPKMPSLVALLIAGLALQDVPFEAQKGHLRLLDSLLEEQVSSYGFLRTKASATDHLQLFQNLLYLRMCSHGLKHPIPAQLQGALHKFALGLRLSVVGSHTLLSQPLTPFQKNGLSMGLSKIPGKMSPQSWVKEDSFLRAPIGKAILHAHCRQGLHFHLSSPTAPLCHLYTMPILPQATQVPALLAKWSDGNLLLNQSLTYQTSKTELIHSRQLYVRHDASDIRAHETLIGEGGEDLTFMLSLAPQVTKVSPLEKEGGILISSLKMGTWILKINGASRLSLRKAKLWTMNGDQQPHYIIKFSAPFAAGGYQVKWSLKLLA
ncbi:hypothetical protein OAN22_00960 [Alphaproteobacteria bacterium]|nr:hypothetical protein [Alphaproteobacteria bacterium]